MELPLTATVLNKRSGITIIGSVGDYHAQVELILGDQSVIRLNVDENGLFLSDIGWEKIKGDDITVRAMLSEPKLTNETKLHIQAPDPIVTAVLSTQGITRKLTGSVNQPGLFIEVHTPENTHPIEVLIDDKLEFELQIPIALRPEDLRVTALNPVNGEQMEVPVEIGVTTKTMTIPILTDEMIDSYAVEAEGRRAASEAYDHSLMEKAAASEAFVNSIVESISSTESKQASSENEENRHIKADNYTTVNKDSLDSLESEDVLKEKIVKDEKESENVIVSEKLKPLSVVNVEVLKPHDNKFKNITKEVHIPQVIDNDESEFNEGDEQIATATGVAEVIQNGDQQNIKITEPRLKVKTMNEKEEVDDTNYSRIDRGKKKQKKGGLIAFLKRIFSRKK